MKTAQCFRWVAAVCVLAGLCSLRVVQAQNVTEGFYPDVTGSVLAAAIQPDGKILIGGAFTAVSGIPRTNLARLYVDGRLDEDFDAVSLPAAGVVSCLALQADGKILVGGRIATLNGEPRSSIGRLHADGNLDTAFNPGASGPSGAFVSAMAVQADGKILVGGSFTTLGGELRTNLGRLNANGSGDTTFNPPAGGTPGIIHSLAVEADGKILVGGGFTLPGGQSRTNLARLHADGRLDTGFTSSAFGGVVSVVRTLAVQVDGRIVVGGEFNALGGQPRMNVGRLNANGSLDTTFAASANSSVLCSAIQADGKILLGGLFTSLNGQGRDRYGRLNANGTLDTSFDPTGAGGGTTPAISSLAVQADGRILVAGTFSFLGGLAMSGIGRISPRGDYDLGFSIAVDGSGVAALAVNADGTIWVGGQFTRLANTTIRTNIFGYFPATNNYTPRTTAANDFITSFAMQEDGRIVVGGQFTRLNGQTRNRIGRLNANGSLDTAFNPGAGGTTFPVVYSLAMQRDGKILVGGEFGTMGGQSHSNIARLNANGSADAAFNAEANRPVSCLTVQSDGMILVGGSFTLFNNTQSYQRLVRLFPADGHLDTAFDPNVGGTPHCIVVQPDGRILVGGTFNTVGGIQRSNIARLHPDGSLDTTFNASADNYVNCLALLADGKILVGGRFSTLGGQPRSRIGRLHPDGSVDETFNLDLDNGPFAEVESLAVQGDGKILVGGSFRTIGGLNRTNLARLAIREAALESLTLDSRGTVTWNRSGSGPEFHRVTFEGSFDGADFLSMGEATFTGGAWRKAGALLGQGQIFYLRALGRATGGNRNGSGSVVESVRQFFWVPSSRPVLASSFPDDAGRFQFGFPYTSGFRLDVMATTNVAQPGSNWIVIGSPVEFAPRQYHFADAETNLPRRFYRVSAP